MLEWSDRFAVGVSDVDRQHQELFHQINNLLEACNQGRGKNALPEILNFLGKYVVEHFATEERYMEKYRYPQFSEHKKVHEDFVKTFLNFRKDAEMEEPGVRLVVQMNRVIIDWLKNHILRMDQEMGKFLQKAMEEQG
ncbi:MAG: bacteriohemerythrin [Candidatus Caldatribacteriaceae bacterium]